MIETNQYKTSVKPGTLPSEAAMRTAKGVRIIRLMIWLYLIMIIAEGILRKWVFPFLNGPLLFTQDALVFVIYYQCYVTGMIPKTPLFYCILVLGVLSLIAGFIVLPDSPATVLYGFRSNFFQLPMIFVIPMVFDAKDVRKVGLGMLAISIPVAMLMVAQYQAPANSFLNKGAGGMDGVQLASALGHIRPAGPFSFTRDIPIFFTVVCIFLCDGLFVNKKYPIPLMFGALAATGIGVAVSGSRSAIASCALMLVVAILVGLLKPGSAGKSLKLVMLLVVTGAILSQVPVFKDGLNTTATRAAAANDDEGGVGQIANNRVLKNYTRPFELLDNVPLLGQGLGLGTFAGAALIQNSATHSLVLITDEDDAEMDLARNVHESGPFLGLLFVVYRMCLGICVFWYGLQCTLKGTLLPLLFGFQFLQTFIDGSLGVTTDLGFCVAIGGLTIASGIGDAYFANLALGHKARTVGRQRVTPRSRALLQR